MFYYNGRLITWSEYENSVGVSLVVRGDNRVVYLIGGVS